MNSREQNINQLIEYAEKNSDPAQRQQLISLIDQDPLLLSQEAKKLEFKYYGQINKPFFTIAEFTILICADLELVKYILSKISLNDLYTFFSKKFFSHDNNIVTGLHLFVFCSAEKIQVVLEKFGNHHIDELLEQKDFHGSNVPQITCISKDASNKCKLFLEKAVNKKALMSSKDGSGGSLLNTMLLYRNMKKENGSVKWFLDVLDEKAAEVIQHVLPDQWTVLHQVVARFTDTPIPLLPLDDIQAVINKLAQDEQAKKNLLNLIFNQKNNRQQTPYDLAKTNNRDDVITLFLQQINFDDIEELRKVIHLIEGDIVKYPDIYNHLSIQGLLNVIALTSNNIDVSVLISKWIELVQQINPMPFSTDFVIMLNEMIRAYPKNLERLVTHENFFEAIQKFPYHSLLMANIAAHNVYKKYQNNQEKSYQKVIFDIIFDIVANKNEWTLAEKLENELKLIFSKAKKSYPDVVSGIGHLYGRAPDAEAEFYKIQAYNEKYKFPEISYLLALCHRYGQGTVYKLSGVVDNYFSAYTRINKQIQSNPEDKDLPVFKAALIQDVCTYFDEVQNSRDKCGIAVLLTKLFLLEKQYTQCRFFLKFLSDNSSEDTHHFRTKESELYFDLYQQTNDPQDLERSVQLQHGPALIEKARRIMINGNGASNYEEASSFYYRAIVTIHAPVVGAGIEGLKACLEKTKVEKLMRLDAVARLVRFVREKEEITGKDKNGGLYLDFLHYLINEYDYAPAKHALMKKHWRGPLLTDNEQEETKHLLVLYDFIKQKKGKIDEYDFAQALIHLIIKGMGDPLLPTELVDCQTAIEFAKKELNSILETSNDSFLKILILMVSALTEESPLQSQAFQQALILDQQKTLIQTALETITQMQVFDPASPDRAAVLLVEMTGHNNGIPQNNTSPARIYPDMGPYEHMGPFYEPSAPADEGDIPATWGSHGQNSMDLPWTLSLIQGQLATQQQQIGQLSSELIKTQKDLVLTREEIRIVHVQHQEVVEKNNFLQRENDQLSHENNYLRAEVDTLNNQLVRTKEKKNPMRLFSM